MESKIHRTTHLGGTPFVPPLQTGRPFALGKFQELLVHGILPPERYRVWEHSQLDVPSQYVQPWAALHVEQDEQRRGLRHRKQRLSHVTLQPGCSIPLVHTVIPTFGLWMSYKIYIYHGVVINLSTCIYIGLGL